MAAIITNEKFILERLTLAYQVKDLNIAFVKIKNPPQFRGGMFRVTNGARTHDPQNHNLML